MWGYSGIHFFPFFVATFDTCLPTRSTNDFEHQLTFYNKIRKMKRNPFSIAFLLLLFVMSKSLFAETADTLNTKEYQLNEVTVLSPRETSLLKDLPVAGTSISAQSILNRNIMSLKDISAYVPNLFIPDYGSKLTSTIYIRGVGARITGSSVGLYVDNVPYLDKSAFDFDFYDIAHIEVLRGPQGTLYGRNSMGGIVNITTLSPFDYQGNDLLLSVANYNQYHAGISIYHKLSKQLGFSFSGNYRHDGGFFTNVFTGKKADAIQALGGRARLEWRPNNRWKAEYTLGYEYSDQNGYPYGELNASGQELPVNYNDPGTYRRNLLNNALFIQYTGDHYSFSSTTGYQYFNDRMQMDQDFTPDSIFSLTQNQKQSAWTQEFVFKSDRASRYQWVTGLFGFYQGLTTDAPMVFEQGGIAMIQSYFDMAKAQYPTMPTITVTNQQMAVPGLFKTPTQGLALYHQSTYRLWKGLSVTGGLRLSYETTHIDYNTSAALNTSMQVAPTIPAFPVDSTYQIKGHNQQDAWELLPKIAVKYDFNDQYNLYGSVAKGYKAGGYNFEMFSDLLTAEMSNSPMPPIQEAISYKPESSWNYEIGMHSQPIKNKLFVDAALFYINTSNQQIVTYTPIYTTRIITNAGRSESKGFEAAIRSYITDDLAASVSYGYSDAIFTKYDVVNQQGQQVSYKGNHLPFAPLNTLSVTADYTLHLHSPLMDKLMFNVQTTGVGPIYWTEDNSVSQNFYTLLNGRVTAEKGAIQLSLWTKNALNTDYRTFYFESMGNHFAQRGKPAQVGVDLRIHF